MLNQTLNAAARSMLTRGTFVAVLGITLGCGAISPISPTAPTPAVPVARPDTSGYSVIADTNTVARGAQLNVSWTAAIGYVEDSISLSKVGEPHVGSGWARPTGGAASGTFAFTAPAEPGQYEFRYLLEDLSVAARSRLVTVQ